MYIAALLIGIGVGFFFGWLIFAGRIKLMAQQLHRLGEIEAQANRLQADNAALLVDKTRLEQERIALAREKVLIEKNFL